MHTQTHEYMQTFKHQLVEMHIQVEKERKMRVCFGKQLKSFGMKRKYCWTKELFSKIFTEYMIEQ